MFNYYIPWTSANTIAIVMIFSVVDVVIQSKLRLVRTAGSCLWCIVAVAPTSDVFLTETCSDTWFVGNNVLLYAALICIGIANQVFIATSAILLLLKSNNNNNCGWPWGALYVTQQHHVMTYSHILLDTLRSVTKGEMNS